MPALPTTNLENPPLSDEQEGVGVRHAQNNTQKDSRNPSDVVQSSPLTSRHLALRTLRTLHPQVISHLDEAMSAGHHIPATQVAVPGPSTPTEKCGMKLFKALSAGNLVPLRTPQKHLETNIMRFRWMRIQCRGLLHLSSVPQHRYARATTDGFNCLLTTGNSLKQQSSYSCKLSMAFPPLLWNWETDSLAL